MKTFSIWHLKRIEVLATAAILTLSAVPALAVPITVVDVVPNNQSFETDPNSEPSIAVDPEQYPNRSGQRLQWLRGRAQPIRPFTALLCNQQWR
jgi:hypothetical protein